MNRIPVPGDIISIRNREQVCVTGYSHTHDSGDVTHVFNTIKRDDLGKVNPRINQYEVIGGPPIGHTPIAIRDIVFHEQVKLKTTVQTTYTYN